MHVQSLFKVDSYTNCRHCNIRWLWPLVGLTYIFSQHMHCHPRCTCFVLKFRWFPDCDISLELIMLYHSMRLHLTTECLTKWTSGNVHILPVGSFQTCPSGSTWSFFSAFSPRHSGVDGFVIYISMPSIQPTTEPKKVPLMEWKPRDISSCARWFGKSNPNADHQLTQSTTPQTLVYIDKWLMPCVSMISRGPPTGKKCSTALNLNFKSIYYGDVYCLFLELLLSD